MPIFWSVDLTPDFQTLLMTECFEIYMQKIEESIHQNAHCQLPRICLKSLLFLNEARSWWSETYFPTVYGGVHL